MKLHAPFVQLPIRFDARRMAEEIGALGESAWRPHPQNFPGNSMLPLVAIDGDPGNERFRGAMKPTPDLMKCPYILQVLSAFGATIGRTRLMRLSGGAEVIRHVDQGYYWAERVRVHVPVVTQPSVRFECGDATINMAEGECWIFDTWRQHRVLNDDNRSRIHLVCDTVGGDKFWALVKQGSIIDKSRHTAYLDAPVVTFNPPYSPPISYEAFNLPTIMSPWELRMHLDFLLSEAVQSPDVEAMRQYVQDLYRGWLGIWAKYADSEIAEPEYRHLMGRFFDHIDCFVGNIALKNDVPMLPVLMGMVANVAVIGRRL